jgi:hypothetical protein
MGTPPLPLGEAFHDAVENSASNPIPGSLESFFAAMIEADDIDIGYTSIFAKDMENYLDSEYPEMTWDQQIGAIRMRKAIAQSKGEMFKVMNKRAVSSYKPPAADGGGWNPFFGRFQLDRYQSDWNDGPYTASLEGASIYDLDGDEPEGSVSSIVTPGFDGFGSHNLQALSATCKVLADEPSWWDDYPEVLLHVQNFSYSFPSYELSSGISTGVNSALLNPHGSAPWGQYNIESRQFKIRLEGMFINGLHDISTPMLFFANISGVVGDGYSDGMTGTGNGSEVIAGADNAMIVPLINEHAKMGLPKLAGAHILDYVIDGGGMLRFRENTTLAENADVSMVRHSDGSYAIDPGIDPVVGATVNISPLSLVSRGPEGVYKFSGGDVELRKDSKILMTGTLVEPVLNLARGDFFAELRIDDVSESSDVLCEIRDSEGMKMMQIAAGPGAYEFASLTHDFTYSGIMPYPEIFHLGVVGDGFTPCVLRGDLNNDGSVDAKDLAMMSEYWLKTCYENVD